MPPCFLIGDKIHELDPGCKAVLEDILDRHGGQIQEKSRGAVIVNAACILDHGIVLIPVQVVRVARSCLGKTAHGQAEAQRHQASPEFSHRYPPLAEISVSPLLLYYKQARISTFYGMEKAAVLPLLSYY